MLAPLLLVITTLVVIVEPKEWYETGVLYQIYPRSFRDSDNDGIGDLKGILEKIDLFSDAGITAFWLSPIFASPQVDQGYDVSDYYTVDPVYGTNDDLKQIITEAHRRGIKVLLDFIPNHTSDLHDWFKKSVSWSSAEDYKDFYVWKKGGKDKSGNPVPPNNWLSLFGGSAWEYNKERDEFYLHQFTKQQPELNYASPKMKQALLDVMTFWLDFGVDGFRVDAVPYIVEDLEFRDEPVLSTPGCTPNVYTCLKHIYTKDQPGSFDVIYEWRDFIEEYNKKHPNSPPKIFVTEAYADFNTTLLYYGNRDGTRLGAHFTFNFDFITYLNHNSKPKDIINIINNWQTSLNKSWTLNWVLGNHDNHRVATRLGFPDSYNMLTAFLPGVAVTYQGEEIGMEDGFIRCEDGMDPVAISDCTIYSQKTRDFERTPYQWDTSKNAGFNDGAKPWLPVSTKYFTNNLADQNVTGKRTHYNLYKDYLKFHTKIGTKEQQGDIRIYEDSNNEVLILSRSFVNKDKGSPDTYVLFFNMDENNGYYVRLPEGGEALVVLVSPYSAYEKGDRVSLDKIDISPADSIVVKLL